MKASAVLFLIGYLVVPSGAAILGRCVVAKRLRDGGLSGFEGYSLENWVCLAYFESKFNPVAVYENIDGLYTGYGLFQIRNPDWCDRGRNRCHVSCSDKGQSQHESDSKMLLAVALAVEANEKRLRP
ncbi:Lysozyme-like protein 4 [Myotis davidii]|uniref:Lysozyme-like protein 4 n=1 Tax=Myotis davidii TaxID=225400 RepID=L5LGV0_MYODS|nr:Lysozyme-like protein 4 [Myotis davidii]